MLCMKHALRDFIVMMDEAERVTEIAQLEQIARQLEKIVDALRSELMPVWQRIDEIKDALMETYDCVRIKEDFEDECGRLAVRGFRGQVVMVSSERVARIRDCACGETRLFDYHTVMVTVRLSDPTMIERRGPLFDEWLRINTEYGPQRETYRVYQAELRDVMGAITRLRKLKTRPKKTRSRQPDLLDRL